MDDKLDLTQGINAKLYDAIMALAVARKECQEKKETADAAWDAVKATPELQAWDALDDQHRKYQRLVDYLESKVRGLAHQAYGITGKKDMGPVKIKTFKSVIYDTAQAIQWCILASPKALRLDTKMFEKAAEAVSPDFVRVEEYNRAQIASDLSGQMPPASYRDVIETVIGDALIELDAIDQAEQEQKANH